MVPCFQNVAIQGSLLLPSCCFCPPIRIHPRSLQNLLFPLLPQIPREQYGKLSTGNFQCHGGRVRIWIGLSRVRVQTVQPGRAVPKRHACVNRLHLRAGSAGESCQLLPLFVLEGSFRQKERPDFQVSGADALEQKLFDSRNMVAVHMGGDHIVQPPHPFCLQKRQDPIGSHLGDAGAAPIHEHRRPRLCAQEKGLPLPHVQHRELKASGKPQEQQKVQKRQAARAAQPFHLELWLRSLFLLFRLLLSQSGRPGDLLFPVLPDPKAPQKEGRKTGVIQDQLPFLRLPAVEHGAWEP